MRLIDTIEIEYNKRMHKIQLLKGDLATIPRHHAADILVVSAFRGDYLPTPESLIGSLYRKAGVSLEILSDDKEIDLREQFAFWVSKPTKGQHFSRVLCLESGWRGSPPEITDDFFRALASVLSLHFHDAIIAMPIIGAGDQGFDAGVMLSSILKASTSWIRRGLPLAILKIVAYTDAEAEKGHQAFSAFRQNEVLNKVQPRPETAGFDVFVSYSHQDIAIANYVIETLTEIDKNLRIFIDYSHLKQGGSWPDQLADALDASRRVVALYSQDYWTSNICKSEFLAAFTRQADSKDPVLFPIYLNDAKFAYLYKTIQYLDCRINDREKVRRACQQLGVSLR